MARSTRSATVEEAADFAAETVRAARAGASYVPDRPRERLRSLGGRALTNRELVALLLGSGSGSGTALEVADRVLARSGGSLRRLGSLSLQDLEKVRGVGAARAARLVAATEMGRRQEADRLPSGVPLQGPHDVERVMGPRLRPLTQEEFHVLLVDRRNRLLRDVLVTRGLLDASLVHPREIFREAVTEGAASVILVHNHPSGDPTPSAEDVAVTENLRAAGEALGIPVLDHVIVAERGHRSMMAVEPRGFS